MKVVIPIINKKKSKRSASQRVSKVKYPVTEEEKNARNDGNLINFDAAQESVEDLAR